MYHVLAQVEVPADRRDEYVALMRDFAQDCLRTEVGTVAYEIIQDQDNPNRFYFHETYTDEAAFQAHMHGPAAQRDGPRILAIIGDNWAFVGKGTNITLGEH